MATTTGSKYSRWLSSKNTETLLSQATDTMFAASIPLSSCIVIPFISTLGSESRTIVPAPSSSLAMIGNGPFGSPTSLTESPSESSQLAMLDSATTVELAPATVSDDGWFRSTFDRSAVRGSSSAKLKHTENSGRLSNERSINSLPENLELAPIASKRPFPVPKSSASTSMPPSVTKSRTISPSEAENGFDGPMIMRVSVEADMSRSCRPRWTIVTSVPVACVASVGAKFPSSYVDFARLLVPFHPVLYIEKSVVVDRTGESIVSANRPTVAIISASAMYPRLSLRRISSASSEHRGLDLLHDGAHGGHL